ncbi:MAG: hypothetical protein ACJAWQ_000636 [Paraglaciecola sp.]|mgnify:CR=1 FL=1|jgi:hypothetical protein
MITFTSIEQCEHYLLNIVNQQNKDWLKFGRTLSEIQASDLYFQQNYASYSAWQKSFSKKSGVGTTKLWKCLRVFKMLKKLEIPTDSIATESTNGLAEIARVYELTNSESHARELIQNLADKQIKIVEIKGLVKSLSEPVRDCNEISEAHDEEQITENVISNEDQIVYETEKPQESDNNVDEHQRNDWNYKLVASSIALCLVVAAISIAVTPNIFQ